MAAVLYAARTRRDRGTGIGFVEALRMVVEAGVCLLNCELRRVARLNAEAGAPLLKEVRNCEVVVEGNLLQIREALCVALYPRDTDAACRGSITVV